MTLHCDSLIVAYVALGFITHLNNLYQGNCAVVTA